MKLAFLPYRRLKSIHFVSAIVLFWGMSDAIVSFYIPIQVESFVQNLTLFGFLFSFSSLVGSLSDPILGYLSSKIRYTALMFIGLLLSILVVVTAIAPLSIVIILWLMGLWGLYYEFIEIGIFNYVSRHHHAQEQSRYFGIVYLFLTLPYIVGPVIGGYLISHGARAIYGLCLFFILLAMLFLPRLVFLHHRRERPLLRYDEPSPRTAYKFIQQLKGFGRAWKYASVFLVGALIYNIWEAFIWTLVHIESIGGSAIVAGLITSVFALPLAVFSGYGGEIADKFGRNATFITGFFVAALATLLFGLQTQVLWQLSLAGLASLGFAFAYPAMMGQTSQQGQEHHSQLGTMAATQRLFVNGGFIIGPILGGFFGKHFGIQYAFTALGVLMLCSLIPLTGALIHFHIKGRIHKEIVAEFNL